MSAPTEADSIASFVQGFLYQDTVRILKPVFTEPVTIEQPDAPGELYARARYFLVRLASGAVLRVSVTVDKECAPRA